MLPNASDWDHVGPQQCVLCGMPGFKFTQW
jgi:hypothetical protein